MKKGKPSQTAENNAFLRAAETLKAEGDRICSDPFARYFLGTRFRLLLKIPFFKSSLLTRWEKRVPGVALAVLSRSRYIDDFLATQISQGIRQLVIMGAGFDTRAYRFCNVKNSFQVFELDFPDTQYRKIKTIKDIFGEIPSHVIYIPIDFTRESLDVKLFENGYDNTLRTAFIWEGVTYYIPENCVHETLNFISAWSPKKSVLVFDYFPSFVISGDHDLAEAKNLVEILKRIDEQIIFGVDPDCLDRFLSEHGLRLMENICSRDINRLYFGNRRDTPYISDMFYLAWAKVL